MTRTVYLLRHGKTIANQKGVNNPLDDALTKESIADAKAAAPWFAKQHFDVIYCSTLKRARQTASAIGFSEKRVVFDERLADINLGTFAGTPLGTVHKHCAENGIDYASFTPPQGESHEAWYARVQAFAKSLPSNGSFLVIAHAGVLAHLAETLVGHHLESYPENLALWVIEDARIVRVNVRPWLRDD